MSENIITCKFCPETPKLTYEFQNSSLIINCECQNFHKFKINIEDIKNLKKLCGKCNNIISVGFNYSSSKKYYLCKNCISKEQTKENLLNIYSIFLNIENKNELNDFIFIFQNHFTQLLNITNKFIHSKFYDIYQIFIQNYNDLLRNNCFNQELIENMKNFQKIDFESLLEIYDNYKIIFEENEPRILFSNLFNISFRKYYFNDMMNFSEIINLIKLYEKYNITSTLIDEELFFKFLKESVNKLRKFSDNCFNKINDIVNEIKIKEYDINANLKFGYYDLKDNINDDFYSTHTIPSIFIFKRKLIKGIIDFIHSKEYYNLPPVKPNYKLLFIFFNRLYHVKDEIEDKNLLEKIENILYVIKEKLYELIKDEKNELKKLDDINKTNGIKEFTKKEIEIINQKVSKLEKTNIENKCEYCEVDKKIIQLKFILSFLNYIKEIANNFIHILLEKNSEFFYHSENQQNSFQSLKEYIDYLYKMEIISEKVTGKKLIEMYLFEPNIKKRKENIMNQLEKFLNNKDIIFNNIDTLDFSLELNRINTYLQNIERIINYIKNIILTDKEYEKFLTNDLEEINAIDALLGKKRKREILNNNYISYIIKELNQALLYIEFTLTKSNNLKQKFIEKKNKMIEKDLKIQKIQIMIKELKKYPMKEFSYINLFNEWKEKELKKILIIPKREVFNTVNMELNNLTLEILQNNIKSYVDLDDKNFYFYNEEGDISKNLFLYQNQISPDLCKLIYKYIK